MQEGAYSKHGIVFQCALAGGVSTPALGNPNADGIITVTPDAFAEASLRFLGAPKTVAPPHPAQAMAAIVLDSLPRRLVWRFVDKATVDLIQNKLAKEGAGKTAQ